MLPVGVKTRCMQRQTPDKCPETHRLRRYLRRLLRFDKTVWNDFVRTSLWRGVLPAAAIGFAVIFLLYRFAGGVPEEAVMRRALLAAGICALSYVIGIWCAVRPERKEQDADDETEEEDDGKNDTVGAKLKVAGALLLFAALLAWPSIEECLKGAIDVVECAAHTTLKFLVVGCVLGPVWRRIGSRTA